MSLFSNFFTSGPFIPHGHCYLWQKDLVWLHLLSDSFIALAYYSIPLTLFYFVYKRKDLPFNWIFLLFAAFIVACGTTHVMEVWTLWHPDYWISGVLKALTAMVSMVTAIELVPLIPKALALPSPAQLEQANRNLQAEIQERLKIEAQLRQIQNQLEQRVEERTAALVKANEQLQQEIRERQSTHVLLDTLINNAPIGIAVWDEQLRYVQLNQALADMNGLPLALHVGKTIAELLPGVSTNVTESLRQVLTRAEPLLQQEASGETPAAPGKQRNWLVSYFPIHLPGGLTWAGAICEEITERKQREASQRILASISAALVTSLDEQTILTNLTQLLVPALADYCLFDIFSPQGTLERLVWHHRDLPQSLWLSQEQNFIPAPSNIHHPILQTIERRQPLLLQEVTPDWLHRIAAPSQQSAFPWQSQVRSLLILPLSARNRQLGALTLALTDASQRFYNTIDLSLAEDLAYRVALAIDNAQLYYHAQEANRIKDEFLAVLSHELRSPLNPILGWAKILLNRRVDEPTTRQAISIIERNAKIQIQLIDDLLDVSRILKGKLSLTITDVDLKAVITAAIETVRLAAEAKQIQIQTRFLAEEGLVRGDVGRLQQVIWNLLSNAIKFTPSGGRIEIRVESGAQESEELNPASPSQLFPVLESASPSIKISVIDTGKGITPEFLPYIFDYFRQADSSTTRKFGGLGLGLAIARHIIELHGGTIAAESPGEAKGATFTVHLPLMSRDYHLPSEGNTLVESVDLQGLKVLLVDDDTDTREFLTFLLEQLGADVTAVGSAMEALAVLASSHPDVLISDIGMPDLDGYELIQKVRSGAIRPPACSAAEVKNIPAIALTAYAGELDRQQIMAAGFQKHICKPVDPDQLVEILATLT